MNTKPAFARRGMTLLELLIALSILGGVLLAIVSTLGREGNVLRTMTDRTQVSLRGQQLLGRLDELLGEAQPHLPDAWLAEGIDPLQTTRILLDSTIGFPDQGVVILEPGTLREEHVRYTDLRSSAGPRLLGLERGIRCTTPVVHGDGSRVIWAGTAHAIPQQIGPPPSAYDGQSLERGAPVFFRGDGTGFSFRVPTDPTGGNDVLAGLEVQWGSTLRSQQLLTGRCAIVYVPERTVSEFEIEQDLDGDGARDTTFDVGELQLRIWDTNDAGLEPTGVALSGAQILQAQCNHGGDLDNDGFDDPMFLWTPDSGRLRVRLFLLSEPEGQLPTVSRLETVLRLRNPPAS